ncbi:O-antigen ligase family protein [Aquibacillus rhizosphaerae]|uniref:O-antigen ligase family protein n=1 Tax=Aquibacillus rhizosphaerae TaxID=3051431 RepID=A0ABT7L195_9BACI|nr:O-antigen ligase family protein [Aquibacillus sp. LR5S19]MDL4838957.1 O-antigen ligase family protein [Aquibacillus sp. LR5S19]
MIGIYSLAIIIIPIIGIALYKAKLNSNIAIVLLIFTIYVNLFQPLSIFPVLSLLVDGFAFYLVAKHFISNGINKKYRFWLGIVILFITISFLQVFNPNIPSISAGIEGFRKTSFAFIYFFIGLIAFSSVKQIKKIIFTLSISSLIVLLYGIKQYLFPSNFDSLYLNSNDAGIYTGMLFGESRATSIFSGPFHFGMFAAVISVINLYLMKTAKTSKMKIIFFLLMAISIFACYGTLTRTNLLAMIGALFLSLLLSVPFKKVLVIFPIIFIIIVSIINIIALYGTTLINSENKFIRLVGTIGEFSQDSRLLGRVDGWEEIYSLFLKQPIAGYGTGSAGDTLQYMYDFEYHVTSHNFFLKILMETGIVGFLLITIFLSAVFYSLIKQILTESDVHLKNLLICCFSIFIIFLINIPVGSSIEALPSSSLIMLFVGIGLNIVKNINKYKSL